MHESKIRCLQKKSKIQLAGMKFLRMTKICTILKRSEEMRREGLIYMYKISDRIRRRSNKIVITYQNIRQKNIKRIVDKIVTINQKK